MQRRAAAAFVAFFLIAGAASLSLIATAEEPTFDVQTEPLQQGDTFSAGGTEYTVASVSAEESGGGGHGGGGGVTYEVVVEWTNDSARHTAEWENNSTVEFDGQSWRLLVESAEDPSSFTLVEEINETAILQDDPNAEGTVTSGGERYVVIVEDGERTLVPADEYFPDPETREFSEGQTLQYDGNDTTVASVASGGVTLEWTAPKTMSASAAQQGNLTLSGGQTYYAYFPSAQGDRVVISDNFDALDRFNHQVERFHKHKSGLWGISILSGLTSMLLVAMAYMPSRY